MDAYIAHIGTSFVDIPDRIAVAVFFAGCSIRCKGCQNKILWERSSGKSTSLQDVISTIEQNPLADSVVFLGGEPTDQMPFFIELCKQLPQFKMLYTGREIEDLPTELTDNLDMLVCGPFREDLFVGGFPASSNQRFFKKIGTEWICQKR